MDSRPGRRMLGANEHGRHKTTTTLQSVQRSKLASNYDRATTALAQLAAALADVARRERTAAAARRASDALQVATWIHWEKEQHAAAAGMGVGR